MKYKLNKMYAVEAGAGGGVGGNTAIKVEYTLVDQLIEDMSTEIENALKIIKAANFTSKLC